MINTEFMQRYMKQILPNDRKDTKVVDIIYFSKLLFACFDVSVLQIFSPTFVSVSIDICFFGRARETMKRTCLDITKNHGCFNIIRNKRVK